ncbi:MAG: tetraacyldisaccharide 4'-kinase [bacterium]|jgi:tetraacyldisaccharide-1-P 4'-kinase
MKLYKHILNFLTNKKEKGQGAKLFKLLLKSPLVLSSFAVILFSKIKRAASGVKAKDPGVFVISFGNINMGGAGKTPFSAASAEFLYEKGLKPCIITRGYKGGLKKKSI